jgi:hypothetical protein
VLGDDPTGPGVQDHCLLGAAQHGPVSIILQTELCLMRHLRAASVGGSFCPFVQRFRRAGRCVAPGWGRPVCHAACCAKNEACEPGYGRSAGSGSPSPGAGRNAVGRLRQRDPLPGGHGR